MDESPRFQVELGWLDAVLAAGGALGLLLVIFVARFEHPHSAAAKYIPYEQAVDSARAFAQRSGAVSLVDAKADAAIRYDGTLLNDLQRHYGRKDAIAMLRDEWVPVYTWDVSWTETIDEDTESLGWTRVTLDGRFVGLDVEPSAIPRQVNHVGALAEVFQGSVHADSLAEVGFAFRLDSPLRGTTLQPQDIEADRVFLDQSDAEKLARYHLSRGRFAGIPIRVDSVFASGSDGVVTATVRVTTIDEAPGRFFTADIEVMPGGALVDLDPKFVAQEESDDSGIDADDAREIATFASYVLLAILMVVIFFRRLNARIVDTKTAIRDGVVAALAAAVVMSAQLVGEFDASDPLAAMGFVVGMLLVGLSGGILGFFISGASLSMARERWEEKLQTLALVRSLYMRNVPVGTSMLRGVFAGLALSGIGALVLVLFDDVSLHFSESGDAFFGELPPVLSVLRDMGGIFYWSLFAVLAGVLGMGSLFGRPGRSFLWSMAAIALTITLLQASPWDVRPMPVAYGMGAVHGILIAVLFWRFDTLTTLVAFFVFGLISTYVPNWSAPSAPEFIDALIVVGIVAGLAAVGLTGIISKKRSSAVPVIVPEYIRELAQQERLNRELELAREVQLSFLPARTPDVPELDLASVCLPAYEVGGDYYDFFAMSGGRIGIVVGDVSGKGMQAAFYMTLMKGILQSLTTSLSRPSAILAAANELFRMNAPRGIFMSIVFVVIDLEKRTWTCARAGHNPMLIHRAGAERLEEVKPTGVAIGLASDPIFSDNIEEATVSFSPGDLLLIYTDGITEAMNYDHELFDETRLDDSLIRAAGRSASEVLAAIVGEVERFTGDAPRHDDMTMVAIRILNA